MASCLFFESDETRYEIGPGDSLSIGRFPDNDIVLRSVQASRKHAVLDVIGHEVRIMDLSSLAGTRVNGALLPPGEWLELRIGDRVAFADELFVLRADGVPMDDVDWESTVRVKARLD